jgi:hypothetical protein
MSDHSTQSASMAGSYIDPGVRIGHVHLKVSDLDRALAFYCGVLGFRLTQRYGDQALYLAHYLESRRSLGMKIGSDHPKWRRKRWASLRRIGSVKCCSDDSETSNLTSMELLLSGDTFRL